LTVRTIASAILETLMQTRYKKIMAFVVLVALTAVSTLALAQELPATVGRIALTQGQVSLGSEPGDEMEPALLNWPVTSRNQISTGRGARTEVRVGSTAIRLDGDSAMEVTALDDDTLSLHLHYGSASIRVRNPDVLRGFRLTTPQGQILLKEPGRYRVDVDRLPDTTVVNVFDGLAVLDSGGSSLTVRANRRAELHQDDIRTTMAARDGFDDWAMLRDQREDRIVSERYVGREMTGYEDLDQYGAWSDDREYGPLWAPRHVPSGWVPYRDGRWTWVSPWGWTWVDNAPWGYAPFHYGRWVIVNQRWCWAPGRNIGRPVWAPALVGWIGGSNWQLSFGSRTQAPAQGWYPLGPRHSYVPSYRAPEGHLRYINRWAQPDHRDGRRDGHWDHDRRTMVGLTVVPQAQFNQRGTVVVPNVPRAVVPPVVLQTAPVATPPAPGPRAGYRGNDERFDRRERNEHNDRVERNDRNGRDERDLNDRHDRGGRIDRVDRNDHGNRPPQVAPPAAIAPQAAVAPPPPQVAVPVVPQVHTPSPRYESRGNDERFNRRGNDERFERRGNDERFERRDHGDRPQQPFMNNPPQRQQPQPQQQAQPQPQPQQQPQHQQFSRPAPAVQAPPPPPPQAAPMPVRAAPPPPPQQQAEPQRAPRQNHGNPKQQDRDINEREHIAR
jgi:hypothetical protein